MNTLEIVDMLACACLLVHAVCVINRMTPRTNHVFRIAYILLGVGALGVLLGPLYGYTRPNAGEVLVNAGAALALIVGRWLRHGGFKREHYSSLTGDLRDPEGRAR